MRLLSRVRLLNQQVLTLAGNKVNFQAIRQSLRAFADERDHHRRRHRDRPTWWATEEDDLPNDEQDDDNAGGEGEETY